MSVKGKYDVVRFTLDIPTPNHFKLKLLSVRRKKTMKDMILHAIDKIVKDVVMEDEQ